MANFTYTPKIKQYTKKQWKPIEKVEEISGIKALSGMAGTPEWNALGKKLGVIK